MLDPFQISIHFSRVSLAGFIFVFLPWASLKSHCWWQLWQNMSSGVKKFSRVRCYEYWCDVGSKKGSFEEIDGKSKDHWLSTNKIVNKNQPIAIKSIFLTLLCSFVINFDHIGRRFFLFAFNIILFIRALPNSIEIVVWVLCHETHPMKKVLIIMHWTSQFGLHATFNRFYKWTWCLCVYVGVMEWLERRREREKMSY